MNSMRNLAVTLMLALAACTTTPTKSGPTPAPTAAPTKVPSATSAAVTPPPAPVVPAPSAPPLPLPAPPASVSAAPVVDAKPAVVPAPVAAAKKALVVAPAAAAIAATPKAAPAAPAKEATKVEPANAVVSGGNTLSGHLDLIAAAGQSVDQADVANAVVYFVPTAHVAAPKPSLFRIYTRNKAFDPESIVIPLGSTISFPNKDEILHNVFSVTPGSEFDLGLYGEGASADYKFQKTGVILINCNAHHVMQANVLVVDTPYYTHPGKDGRFELANLPAGGGKLVVWHPRAALQSQPISVPSAEAPALSLSITKPRITQHANKEGRAY